MDSNRETALERGLIEFKWLKVTGNLRTRRIIPLFSAPRMLYHSSVIHQKMAVGVRLEPGRGN